MRKILALLISLFTLHANSSTTIGYLHSYHIGDTLYDSHPFVEFNDQILIYTNSFNKTGIAVYKKLELNGFKIRLGLTSGYDRKMKYGDRMHTNHTVITDGLAIFIVPSYEIKVGRVTFINAIVGNSINAGFGISL